ncbi:anti-RssB factor [Raoultella terrigena]|uniref:Anti-RssB factor n=1 Tax=Raoultella terrigena TaxID=577 RepID=A0A3P8J0R5_RAOTE|nr:anti-RssB factor [Raoultella terrigena]
MNNVILSIIAKISSMDAESKQLAAQVEAQSLLISALMLGHRQGRRRIGTGKQRF